MKFRSLRNVYVSSSICMYFLGCFSGMFLVWPEIKKNIELVVVVIVAVCQYMAEEISDLVFLLLLLVRVPGY